MKWWWWLWIRVSTRARAFGMNPSTDSGGERKGNVKNEHGGSRRKDKEVEKGRSHRGEKPMRPASADAPLNGQLDIWVLGIDSGQLGFKELSDEPLGESYARGCWTRPTRASNLRS